MAAEPAPDVLQPVEVIVAEAPALKVSETSVVEENTPSLVLQCEAPTEISEMQSQLSEIKAQSETGATTFTAKVVDTSFGFNFWNTTFCARSGMEFLDDLEHVPVEVWRLTPATAISSAGSKTLCKTRILPIRSVR